MRVLVTGGAGYIGSVCTELLCNLGHEVIVYDNLSQGHRSAVDPRAHFIHGRPFEPGDIAAAMRAAKPEAVLHFAGDILVGESMQKPGKYFRNNVACSLEFLEAARLENVRKFIFSSTAATYGLPDQIPIPEDAPQQPVNPYGEAKLMFEKMLTWYHRIHGLEFVAFRYFNAAGATEQHGEDHRPETHLIPNVLKVALGQKPYIEIYGTDYPTPDGTCIRDYIHVVDLVEAHILALQPGICGFFNLGNGDGYSVREVIATCERVTGRRIPSVVRPPRPGDPPRLVASAAKAKRELGWCPRTPALADIVATAWAWHQKHPDGYPD
ncbi:MAG: UDP-glucose 4-epimerase GalE [Verrucomicrobiota bacterium]|nr:UDP-glucose 4-epimerase GalE [Limisphaera sp.]MDW8381961.1 UDP-glucose 4-epimerase GalE [Verrucomicrobiota bacterium]